MYQQLVGRAQQAATVMSISHEDVVKMSQYLLEETLHNNIWPAGTAGRPIAFVRSMIKTRCRKIYLGITSKFAHVAACTR
jgi:hypothetical protein